MCNGCRDQENHFRVELANKQADRPIMAIDFYLKLVRETKGQLKDHLKQMGRLVYWLAFVRRPTSIIKCLSLHLITMGILVFVAACLN